MSEDQQVQVNLVPLSGSAFTIDHADQFAEFFFRTNASSVGPKAYDTWVLTGTTPNRITVDDVAAANRTMAARTPYKYWTKFTDVDADEPWLAELDPEWDLFAMPEMEWLRHVVHRSLGEAFKEVMGPYRGPAGTTKVLHIKRPRLIPVCDSYVAGVMGVRFGDEVKWQDLLRLVMHVRKQGQANLDALLTIQQRLGKAGVNRSLVRILDALLWMRGAENVGGEG